MRTLFLLLVLANAVLFLWWQRQPPEAAPPPATEPGIAPLRLLSESRPAATPGETAPAPAASAAPERPGSGSNTAAVTETVTAEATQASTKEATGGDTGKGPSSPSSSQSSQPLLLALPLAALPGTAPHPQTGRPERLAAVPSSVQTAPSRVATAPAVAPTAAARDHAEVHDAAQDRCYTVGPFMQPAAAEAFAARLAEHGLGARLRRSDKKEEMGYWVYLPPYPSAEAARAVAAELAAKGEKEYFIIRPGNPQANAISLGVFRDRRLAERRHQQLRALGYAAELSVRYRDNPVTWVDYGLSGSAPAPAVEHWRLPDGVQRHTRRCDAAP